MRFKAVSGPMDRQSGCASVAGYWQHGILCCGMRSVETAMKLDRIDIKILHELQKNGRITNVELAELVHLSPSPCLMRVKKLQSEGYIEGYSAQVNIGKLGQTLTVFTEITLKNHRQVDFARFLAVVEKIDQVIECHLVSGGYDYLMKFMTAGISEYQTIMERLTDMDIGIDKYFSFVVLKSPIVKAHMPLPSLFPI
ncbi:transcriptional regulator of lrp regulon and for high-affinity branched-chain amino acid transport system (AsnC family) (modular protein) [Mesorhizobium plurifarium]|uniref:Transcriptional regulator of lrp regulon and for high-affinity branched-chain amino acid transport system (AsnC family) (Modular protein) n=1 Tax=Mesorhizobium plurifarium TaxID=69974 RepID=A0A090EYK9_MESPL|nr:transcriptional regulator of lrp regulon and for high-affinity branched-chain amino acid transport system (AsnC family) (modular protein) [Mesorhizobium plurifarium]